MVASLSACLWLHSYLSSACRCGHWLGAREDKTHGPKVCAYKRESVQIKLKFGPQHSLETALNNQLLSADHPEMMVPSLSLNRIRERKHRSGQPRTMLGSTGAGLMAPSRHPIIKFRSQDTWRNLCYIEFKKQKENNKSWYSILL